MKWLGMEEAEAVADTVVVVAEEVAVEDAAEVDSPARTLHLWVVTVVGKLFIRF